MITEYTEPPQWALDWWYHRSGRAPRIQRPSASLSGMPSPLHDGFESLTGQLVLVVRPSLRPRAEGVARVVAAVRDLPADGPVLDVAGQAAEWLEATLLIAHAVPRSFGQRTVGLEGALEDGRNVLRVASDLARGRRRELTVTAQLFRIWPHELVSQHLGADLLVVGVPAARPLISLDQVATAAVHHGQSSVLLVPKRVVSNAR